MRMGLLLSYVTLLLGGCDNPIQIQEVPAFSKVDVYCSPHPEITDERFGYDIVLAEQDEAATVWRRQYVWIDNIPVPDDADYFKRVYIQSLAYWAASWSGGEKVSVSVGSDRILLEARGSLMFLRRMTSTEVRNDEYPDGVSWLLQMRPDRVSHLCYDSGVLDQEMLRRLYYSKGTLEALETFEAK